MNLGPKRTARSLILMLLVLGSATLPCARALQAPPPQQTDSSDSPPPLTPGQQLVHESREAAGEEKDEMEEFKHSSSVQLISRITGLSLQQSYWLSVVMNFAVIAGVIIWAGRKYLPGLFRDRTAAIRRAMQEAQKASEEARRKLAEIEHRLEKLDAEVGMMREAAEKEGGAEAARIQAATQEDARKIVAAAEQEIVAVAKAARRQLTAHAAELAVGLAQKQIRIDAGTDQALVRTFASELGSERAGKDEN